MEAPWRLHLGDGPSGLLAYGPVDHVICDDEPRDDDETPHDRRQRAAAAIAYQCRRWAIVLCPPTQSAWWAQNLEAAGMLSLSIGVWVQLGAKGRADDAVPALGHRAVVLAHSRTQAPRWNGADGVAVWHAQVSAAAPRPPQLYRQLVEDFTDPGELVADPFCDDGTTGVAAVGLGRRFVGWEIRQRRYERARARLEAPLLDPRPSHSQPDLFSGPLPKSAVGRARLERHRAVLAAVYDANGDGLTISDLKVRIDASDDEIRSSLRRLRKQGRIISKGRTTSTRYFPTDTTARTAG